MTLAALNAVCASISSDTAMERVLVSQLLANHSSNWPHEEW